MKTFIKLLLISRPISWPNTAYPFAAAFLVTGGELSWLFWVGTVFFLFPYNLLMYGVNDVFDYESDIKNPRKGGIEGMRESKALHPLILRSSAVLCLPFVLYLLWAGTLQANIVLGVVLFFVVAYSAAGLRFKERPFLDSVTSSAHFVGPMVYALAVTGFTSSQILYVLAFFAWGMASHAFGAVQDILPDRQGNIRSIATELGAKKTVRFALGLYAISGVLLLATGAMGAVLVAPLSLLYIGNIYRFANVSDVASPKTNTAWRRFLWLNYFAGFVITNTLLLLTLT
ncbi:MAG: prenyltransferase [Candidatus Saccharimonadales bacterium]